MDCTHSTHQLILLVLPLRARSDLGKIVLWKYYPGHLALLDILGLRLLHEEVDQWKHVPDLLVIAVVTSTQADRGLVVSKHLRSIELLLMKVLQHPSVEDDILRDSYSTSDLSLTHLEIHH